MSESSGARGRLNGRRILVTGAASGIGLAIATLFRQEGASLGLLDREPDGLSAAAAKLGAASQVLDLADSAAIEPAVQSLAGKMNGLDGVVNCAALGTAQPIEKTDLALLNKFMAINLAAPYMVCRAATPYLRKEKGSTIVNIASGMGLLPNAPNNTAYAATKGGLIAFSKSLAAELAPHVRVNAVCPGVTNTPMASFLFKDYANPNDAPWVKQYALQRIAEPIEIAQAVLYLTSSESSYVTGSALAVDGGRCFH